MVKLHEEFLIGTAHAVVFPPRYLFNILVFQEGERKQKDINPVRPLAIKYLPNNNLNFKLLERLIYTYKFDSNIT